MSTRGGPGVRCGTLVVPESRTRATDRTVRLAVAILPAPGAEPLLYVSGRSGLAALALAPSLSSIRW